MIVESNLNRTLPKPAEMPRTLPKLVEVLRKILLDQLVPTSSEPCRS